MPRAVERTLHGWRGAPVLTLVGALVIPIVLILLAGELGRRTAGPAAAA